MALLVFKTSGTGTTRPVGSIPAASAMTTPPPGAEPRPIRVGITVGALGTAAVAIGYLLEAIRQRGTCENGDPSPDTIGLSIVLILFVGGITGLVGVVASLVARPGPHRTRRRVIGLALSLVALAGAAGLFVVGGRDPGDWFQHCGS